MAGKKMERALRRRRLIRWRVALIDRIGKALNYVEQLPSAERATFDRWDQSRPKGVGTLDWPGFKNHIPKLPRLV